MSSVQSQRVRGADALRTAAIASGAALLGAFAGCASIGSSPVGLAAPGELRGATVIQTQRSTLPTFKATTPGKAGFGLFGVAAMNSAGNALIAENKVPDPALAIGVALNEEMERRFKARPVSSRLTVDADDVATIAGLARGKARYVIDVKTLDWGTAYFVSDWGRYYVSYSAQARLIDVEKQTVVAQASCADSADKPAGQPSYEELTGNGAARLKSTLVDISARCARQMSAAMFAATAK